MNPPTQSVVSRRDVLRLGGCGFGWLGFAGLCADMTQRAAAAQGSSLAPRMPLLPARARRVIFLFMHGGPSQVDTFDYKPRLLRDHGKLMPVRAGDLVAPNSRLLASPFPFAQHGESGLFISSLFPELAKHADHLCLLRGMHTDGQAHGQSVLKLHTGHETQLRPSMGSWIIYGLGTENQNLPGFVTISPSILNGGPQNYGSAFLPAIYQGTPIGNDATPLSQSQIRHISNPNLPPARQREQLDLIQSMNRAHLARAQVDAHLEGVIESYELAFRMQAEGPKLMDLGGESKATRDLYGVDTKPTDNFARQCLLARRLAEKGVRFVQVNHAFKWDQHANLKTDLERNAAEVDRPIAALLSDLHERGLLDDTLVVWGGEFGRTPTAQGRMDGRDHNPHGFTMWLAGGGVRRGFSHGATDEHGYRAVENTVHMHDLHATVLHLLGLDHRRLTYRHAGRDYRLTDVKGSVVTDIIT
ncbi:MAG: DUF1501 domain-containing protein [Pedosphaera sp.]|nr:DUF1501 domain-containing protein [Pedosphaera sp.]